MADPDGQFMRFHRRMYSYYMYDQGASKGQQLHQRASMRVLAILLFLDSGRRVLGRRTRDDLGRSASAVGRDCCGMQCTAVRRNEAIRGIREISLLRQKIA